MAFTLWSKLLPKKFASHNVTAVTMHLSWFKEVKHIMVLVWEGKKRNI